MIGFPCELIKLSFGRIIVIDVSLKSSTSELLEIPFSGWFKFENSKQPVCGTMILEEGVAKKD